MKNKYAALQPELNLKTRYEEISDMHSYMHKLNDKEKEWLNKFAEEYVIASSEALKSENKPLHRTKKLRKSCYDRNNARNRDILTKANASGKSVSINSVYKEDNTEDSISIEDMLDSQEKD